MYCHLLAIEAFKAGAINTSFSVLYFGPKVQAPFLYYHLLAIEAFKAGALQAFLLYLHLFIMFSRSLQLLTRRTLWSQGFFEAKVFLKPWRVFLEASSNASINIGRLSGRPCCPFWSLRLVQLSLPAGAFFFASISMGFYLGAQGFYLGAHLFHFEAFGWHFLQASLKFRRLFRSPFSQIISARRLSP